MKLLLDTHAFIWWDRDPQKIPPETLNYLKAADNQILLSLASLWEIQIKCQLGKLILKGHLADIVQAQQTANNLMLLPIELSHILALAPLPQHHRDPFDRLLIAQSRVEFAVIISRDSVFDRYECQVIW